MISIFLRYHDNLLVLYLLFCEPLTAAGGKPFSFLLQMTCGSRFFLKKNSKKLLIRLEDFMVNCKGQRELLHQGQKLSPQELAEWL